MANQRLSISEKRRRPLKSARAMAGSMQPTCKQQAEQAKKLGATQLSAPNKPGASAADLCKRLSAMMMHNSKSVWGTGFSIPPSRARSDP